MEGKTAGGIMVIGFDAHFCYLMQRYVRMSAHPLFFSKDNDDVIAQAQCNKPLAIILEVDLPGTIGWQMLNKLKTNPLTQHTPVIVCSWQDEETRCRQAGADVYLRMPVMYENFQTALNNIGING